MQVVKAAGLLAAVAAASAQVSVLSGDVDVVEMAGEPVEHIHSVVGPRDLAAGDGLNGLNAFLKNLRFGPRPGPCPGVSANDAADLVCGGNVLQVERYIAMTQLTVLGRSKPLACFVTSEAEAADTPYCTNFPAGSPKLTQGWLTAGTFKAWGTFLTDTFISSIALTVGDANNNDNRIPFALNVKGINLGFETDAHTYDVVINLVVPLIFPNGVNLGTAKDDVHIIMSKVSDATKIGLSSSMRLVPEYCDNFEPYLRPDATCVGDFVSIDKDDIPRYIDFASANGACVLDLSLSNIAFREGNIGYAKLPLIMDFVFKVLGNLIGGLVAGIVCSTVRSMVWISQGAANTRMNTAGWKAGTFNYLLTKAYKTVHSYLIDLRGAEPGTALHGSFVLGNETALQGRLTAAQAAAAFQWKNDTAYGVITGTLNSVLGGTNSSSGRLVINDLVERFAPGGVWAVPDATKPFYNVDLGAGATTFTAAAGAVNSEFKVVGFKLAGLSSFVNSGVDSFKLMDNLATTQFYNQTASKFQLRNKLKMAQLVVSVDLMITLTPGSWALAWTGMDAATLAARKMVLPFTLSIAINNPSIDAFLGLAWNPKELYGSKLGALLDTPAGQSSLALNCFAHTVYRAELSSLRMSATFSPVTISNYQALDGTIKLLVEQGSKLASRGLSGLLNRQLPAFSETLLKPAFNSNVSSFLAAVTPCWQYQYKPAPQLVDLEANIGALAVRDALNKAFGGNPVQQSNFDVNTLAILLLDTYKNNITSFIAGDSFTLRKTPQTQSDYQVIPKSGNVTGELATAYSKTQTAKISLSQAELKNLGSVYRLQFAPAARQEVRVGAAIGKGLVLNPAGTNKVATNPVQVAGIVSGQVCRRGAAPLNTGRCAEAIAETNDATRITLSADISVDLVAALAVDVNRLMNLDFNDIAYPACALVALTDYGVSSLLLNTTTFYATVAPTQGSWSQSPMGLALAQMNVELSAGQLAKSTAQVRYIIKRVGDYAKQVLNDSAAANKGKATFANCRTYQVVLNSTALSTALALGSALPTAANASLPAFTPQGLIQYWPFDGPDPKTRKVVMPSSTWEQSPTIVVPAGHEAFSVKDNTLVGVLRSSAQNTAAGTQDLLYKLTNSSYFGQVFKNRTDATGTHVDLSVTKAFLDQFVNASFASDGFIEGLNVELRSLRANAIEQVAFAFFQEYDSGAQFTTKHFVSFPFTFVAELTFALRTSGEFVGKPKGTISEEVMTVRFNVTDLRFDLVTFLAVDKKVLNELQLDHFVQVSRDQTFSLRPNFLACLLTPAFVGGAGLPGFQISYSDIAHLELVPVNGNFSTSDLWTDGFAKTLGVALEALLATYQDQMADITQGYLRPKIDSAIAVTLQGAQDAVLCGDPLPPVLDQQYFDFTKSQQLLGFYDFVQNNLLNPSSPAYINNIVNLWLQGGFPSLSTGFSQLPLSYNQQSFGTVSLSLANVRVTNLDTFDSITLFDWRAVRNATLTDAERPYVTRTSFHTGVDLVSGGLVVPRNIDLSMEVRLTVDGLFEPREGMALAPDNSMSRVQDDLKFTMSLSELMLAMELLTKLDVAQLLRVKLAGFLQLAQYPCLLTAFPPGGFGVKFFDLQVGNVTASLECVGVCNSVQLQVLQDQNAKTNQKINDLVTTGIKQGIKILNTYLSSSQLQDTISQEIDASQVNCFSPPQLDVAVPAFVEVANYMAVVALSGLFSALIGFAFLVPLHMKRRDQVMKVALLKTAAKGEAAQADFALQEQRLLSAFRHPAIPAAVRFCLPAWAFINMLFFIHAALFTAGASVQLKLGLFGDTTKPLNLMSFTLASSINDMWNAGTIFLSLAIAILSGAWPYVKNIMLIYAWVAPTTLLGSHKRGFMLEALDALGKWSLIDLYVLIMLCVGFRFYIKSSMNTALTDYLPADAVVVDVVVSPQWGIYGFLFGAIGSLLANHLMIYWNRKALDADEAFEDKINGTFVEETPTAKIAVSQYRFNAADASGRIYGFGPGTKLAVTALGVLAGLFILVGSFVPLINFQFMGIAGIAINLVDPTLATATYSSVEIAAGIVRGASPDFGTRLGILFLQAIFLAFALIVPIALLITFGVLWYVPLTLKAQRSATFLCEIFMAWEALIILIASVLGAVLQISQLAQFIVLNSTGSICANIENFLLGRGVTSSDSKCFDVKAAMEPMGIILTVGCVAMIALSFVMVRLLKGVVKDRTHANKRKECRCPAAPSETRSWRRWMLRTCTVPVARINLGASGSITSFRGESPASDSVAVPNPVFANSRKSGAQIDV